MVSLTLETNCRIHLGGFLHGLLDPTGTHWMEMILGHLLLLKLFFSFFSPNLELQALNNLQTKVPTPTIHALKFRNSHSLFSDIAIVQGGHT